jgi:hypothetical protein
LKTKLKENKFKNEVIYKNNKIILKNIPVSQHNTSIKNVQLNLNASDYSVKKHNISTKAAFNIYKNKKSKRNTYHKGSMSFNTCDAVIFLINKILG